MDVFVYGTLTDPERASAVLEDLSYRGPAVLSGLHRVEGTYPTLAPGGSVEGRVLATDDVAALDRYEGVSEGLYVRVSVPVAGAEGDSPDAGTVEAYVGDPERLDASATWPGDGAFVERVQAFLASHVVVVRARDASGSFEGFDGYEGDATTDVTSDHGDWRCE